MSGEKGYDVGTDNLPYWVRIILSQTEGVNKAAVIHDIHYALGGYFDANGLFIKLSRKQADIIFRDNILEFTGRKDLADAYYKAIRKTGAYGWWRAKIRRILKRVKFF